VPPLTWQVDVGSDSTHVSLRGKPDVASLTAFQDMLEVHCEPPGGSLTVGMSAMSPVDRIGILGSAMPDGHNSIAAGANALCCRTHRPVVPGGRGLRARMNSDLGMARDALILSPLSSASVSEDLLPLPGAARRSRRIIRAAVRGWNLPHLEAVAGLLASELVSHTIRRVSTLMTVGVLRYRDVLYLSVRSGEPQPEPQRGGTRADLDLLLIHATAHRWGFLAHRDDSLTWAALRVPTSGAHAAAPIPTET
jgi:hypothetical protein